MTLRRWGRAVALLLAALSHHPLSARAADAAAKSIAVFDFELIDTSLEPPRPDEKQRLRLLDALLRQRLGASVRYRVVDIAPVRERVAVGPEIRNCNGCEVDYARELGAEQTMTGTVQKVSNLILNINLFEKDVATGALLLVASADIRGNTDESWTRGLDWLLRNRVLAQ